MQFGLSTDNALEMSKSTKRWHSQLHQLCTKPQNCVKNATLASAQHLRGVGRGEGMCPSAPKAENIGKLGQKFGQNSAFWGQN